MSAFAGHSYKFVKRLTKDERKKWGYAGIWEINTVRANRAHPAMFPVELPWRCIKMHSDKGSIVLEPFNGSGTTIIACEQLDRICYANARACQYINNIKPLHALVKRAKKKDDGGLDSYFNDKKIATFS